MLQERLACVLLARGSMTGCRQRIRKHIKHQAPWQAPRADMRNAEGCLWEKRKKRQADEA